MNSQTHRDCDRLDRLEALIRVDPMNHVAAVSGQQELAVIGQAPAVPQLRLEGAHMPQPARCAVDVAVRLPPSDLVHAAVEPREALSKVPRGQSMGFKDVTVADAHAPHGRLAVHAYMREHGSRELLGYVVDGAAFTKTAVRKGNAPAAKVAICMDGGPSAEYHPIGQLGHSFCSRLSHPVPKRTTSIFSVELPGEGFFPLFHPTPHYRACCGAPFHLPCPAWGSTPCLPCWRQAQPPCCTHLQGFSESLPP